MGIEPTPSAWKAEVLPLNYTAVYPDARHAASKHGGGGRITPRLWRSALRVAALHAMLFGAFAPPSNLSRLSSSPVNRGGSF